MSERDLRIYLICLILFRRISPHTDVPYGSDMFRVITWPCFLDLAWSLIKNKTTVRNTALDYLVKNRSK